MSRNTKSPSETDKRGHSGRGAIFAQVLDSISGYFRWWSLRIAEFIDVCEELFESLASHGSSSLHFKATLRTRQGIHAIDSIYEFTPRVGSELGLLGSLSLLRLPFCLPVASS